MNKPKDQARYEIWVDDESFIRITRDNENDKAFAREVFRQTLMAYPYKHIRLFSVVTQVNLMSTNED